MKIHLVFPRLPPTPDGIGDYTARLAVTLAGRCDVKALTAQEESEPIPNVTIQPAFSIVQRRGVWGLLNAVAADPPDWLVLQYNPFSYGRWGFNLHLPRVLHALKRKHPNVRCALMVHEIAPPLLNWRLALMTTWQLAQLWMLGRAADVIFTAIDPWVNSFRRWFRNTPVAHLPVGSNMLHVPVMRKEARRRLGLKDPTFVIGVFGTAHPTRLLHFVRIAAEAIQQETKDVLVLYVGPDGTQVQRQLGDLPLKDAGRVPHADASRYFGAMDVCLAPFRHGVSTRRGSFMAALQHGVATVSTHGRQTDTVLHQANGQAFLLAPDHDPDAYLHHACRLFREPRRRAEMAQAGRVLYRNTFEWEVIATRLLTVLEHAGPIPHPV